MFTDQKTMLLRWQYSNKFNVISIKIQAGYSEEIEN